MLTGARAAVVFLASAMIIASGVFPAQAASDDWVRTLATDFTTAWQITEGRGVTVAVLSSGVDPTVKPLDGAVSQGRDFVGTPDAKRTWGTWLASIIAGRGPSFFAQGNTRGLAPAAEILSVRAYPDDKDPGAANWRSSHQHADVFADAIRYAADQRAGVILTGPIWWGSFNGLAIQGAVDYAVSKGSVVVGANAFDDSNTSHLPVFPASARGAIGVAALNGDGTRNNKWTVRGSSTLVSAPGFDTPATGPGNEAGFMWGSEPAAAWAAAAVALVRSAHPRLTPVQVVQAITKSAHHPAGGYNPDVGFGVINPAGALAVAESIEQNPPAAAATQDTVADRARFGPRPAAIQVALPSTGLVAAFAALIVAGSATIAAAVVLLARGRSRTPAPPNKIIDYVAEREAEPRLRSGPASAESPSVDIEGTDDSPKQRST